MGERDKKYRLLLLDDEEIVVSGIQKVYDLPAMGFDVAGAFCDPKEALISLPALLPDLIITDVKMPQMDGLEFTTRAKQILPEAEIVILSGYGDFLYAQTAVKLGVSDYLLKPVKKADFQAMMEKMYKKIDDAASQREYMNSLIEWMRDNYAELKNRFFLQLAENDIYDEKLYQTLRKEGDLEFDGEAYFLIRGDIYALSGTEDLASVIGWVIGEMRRRMKAYGMVGDFLSDECVYFYIYGVDPGERDAIEAAISEFSKILEERGIPILWGLSFAHRGLNEFFSARNDCVRHIFLSDINVAIDSKQNPVRESTVNVNIPYGGIEDLFSAIMAGDKEGIISTVDMMYGGGDDQSFYRDYSYSITFLSMLRGYQLAQRYDTDEVIVERQLLDLSAMRKEFPTVKRQKEWVISCAGKLLNLVAAQKTTAASKIIRDAIGYIDGHFGENISLQKVADSLNISKNYLCDVFKKEVGITFIHYVTGLRIEKAKEYLKNTDMKMYEVAEAVGYNDYAYFSQIFKKHTGATLSEYRDQI